MVNWVVFIMPLLVEFTETNIGILSSLVSPTGLFNPDMNGFAKRFMAAQKSLQAICQFLQKYSSSVAGSNRQKTP